MNDKRAATGFWVMQVPVISTGHFTEAAAAELSDTLPGEAFHDAPCMVGSHGGMIYCADVENLPESAPQCVRDVLEWGKREGYEWLRLDADGDTIAGLPEYAW